MRDGGVSASVATGGVDTSSSPVVFDGGVYFGTATTVSGHLLQADGTLGAAVSDTNPTGPFFDLISDGRRIYAATRGGGSSKVLLQLDQGLRELKSIAVQSSAQPTINIAGHLVLPDTGGNLYEIVPGSSALPAAFYNTGPVARVPLQGSDGRTYYPSTQGRVFALEGAQLSWVFDPPNNIFRGATMDCAGRLFVASGSVVYALITDDHGLADTPWPAYRRDGRNSGNAGAPKYGIRTATGCAQ